MIQGGGLVTRSRYPKLRGSKGSGPVPGRRQERPRAGTPHRARLRAAFSESLFRNSVFLVLNIGLTAVCGLGSQTLLTHLFSKKIVGLSAPALSATFLVVSITQLGVNFSLPRYLPTSKRRDGLINTLHTLILILTAIGAVIFLLLPVARPMFALGGGWFAVIFLAATLLQAGYSFLGTVLVSDRAASTLVAANSVPNLLKLAAPPVLTSLGGLGAFLARISSTVAGYFTLFVVVIRRGHRFRPAFDAAAIRELGRFSAGMYVAGIIGGLPLQLLPIVVLSRLGTQASAYWSIALPIGMLLYQLPTAVTQALMPEVSLRQGERGPLLRRASLLTIALATPALTIAYVATPWCLVLFGQSYAPAVPMLRWLVIAGYVTMLNSVSGTILFLAKKSMEISIVNVVNAVIVLGMTAMWATNATDVAISWFVGDVANTLLFGFFAYLAVREVGGQLEKLGSVEPMAARDAAGQVPARGPASLQQAFDMLTAISEQQRSAEVDSLSRFQLTEPQGMYSILAFVESEQERKRNIEGMPGRRRQPPQTQRQSSHPDPPVTSLRR